VVPLERARAFLGPRHQAVLGTIKRDGRPQLSNVLYFLDDDGKIKISVTATRAKTVNLRRDSRATVWVPGSSFWQYIVVEGTASLIEGKEAPAALRHYYRRVSGEHPDWAEYDAAMARERRLLLSISVEYAYGQVSE